MGHSPVLLGSIASAMEAEYPASAGFRFLYEQKLPGLSKVMIPDITVVHGSTVVCVVEIGYTRPEKLTAYRDEARISDVRWYDKAGRLHGDVTSKVITVRVSVEPTCDVAVYEVENQVFCPECLSELAREGDGLDESDDAMEEAELDVHTLVITDYVRAFFPSFCDKCGTSWLADPDDEAVGLALCLDAPPRQIGQELGARVLKSWADVVGVVSERMELTLNYSDGHVVDDRVAELYSQRAVAAIADSRTGTS